MRNCKTFAYSYHISCHYFIYNHYKCNIRMSALERREKNA